VRDLQLLFLGEPQADDLLRQQDKLHPEAEAPA
jgi:hypothetical protein